MFLGGYRKIKLLRATRVGQLKLKKLVCKKCLRVFNQQNNRFC
ncbi:hypothetical protein [uncultured Gammaproteobacteria bacterium]|nr:hypothetical protein [uncultured Gammaproteobacteria bacterium]VVH60984.1 hypothetical protein BAZOLSSOX_996 [uncultured Gammaproteobacteria bacterium]